MIQGFSCFTNTTDLFLKTSTVCWKVLQSAEISLAELLGVKVNLVLYVSVSPVCTEQFLVQLGDTEVLLVPFSKPLLLLCEHLQMALCTLALGTVQCVNSTAASLPSYV